MRNKHFINLTLIGEEDEVDTQRKKKHKKKTTKIHIPASRDPEEFEPSFFCEVCEGHYALSSLAVHKPSSAFEDPSMTVCRTCEWLLEHTPIISAQAQTPARE